MKIYLIAALTYDRVIGRSGAIPWRLPDEQQYFKRVTMGSPLVMGRKTYESIGRPLPGRHNIILTRNRAYDAPGCTVAPTLPDALAAAGAAERLFVIGGEAVYRAFFPLADRLYLTWVEAELEGDVYFPAFDRAKWVEIARETHERDAKHAHRYHQVILERG